MTRVSNWQLEQLYAKMGAHLSKKPTAVVPIQRSFYVPPAPLGKPLPLTLNSHFRPRNVDPTAPGNLEHCDYRYFIGHPNLTATFSQCRVCLSVITGRDDRRQHGKVFGCCRLLTDCGKTLLTVGRCLICNSHTSHQRWGWPLCDERSNRRCIEIWQFDVCQPQRLRIEVAKLLDLRKKGSHYVEIPAFPR